MVRVESFVVAAVLAHVHVHVDRVAQLGRERRVPLGSAWVPPSIATRVARGPALEWAAPGWPTLFVGFGVGSLVFLAQAALMIHEIAVANDDKEEGVVGGARVVVARRTRRGEVLEGVV